MARDQVFICYSHEDKDWLDRLHVHLKPVLRERLITKWDDTEIAIGEEWEEKIREALEHTAYAVLLVSADFLASDFIATVELPELLRAAKDDGAIIAVLHVSPSRYKKTPLAKVQAANPPDNPLSARSRHEQEKILATLVESIENTLSPPNP